MLSFTQRLIIAIIVCTTLIIRSSSSRCTLRHVFVKNVSLAETIHIIVTSFSLHYGRIISVPMHARRQGTQSHNYIQGPGATTTAHREVAKINIESKTQQRKINSVMISLYTRTHDKGSLEHNLTFNHNAKTMLAVGLIIALEKRRIVKRPFASLSSIENQVS